MTDTDVLQRWEHYRRANTEKPEARERELRHLFSLLNPQKGEVIWEVGTGNGYLTFPLAEAVGRDGRVHTTDVMEENIADVVRRNESGLPIEATHLPPGELEALKRDAFDAVTSIATLHHFDNRREGTGERGRRQAFKAFHAALKPEGRLVVADVLHGTITQRYFDAIDDPKFCAPHGHPHDFFTEDELKSAAEDAGFSAISISVEHVPWQFSTKDEAARFVHTIHNAQCSPEESLALATEVLGLERKSAHHELGWALFYITAKK